jgi:hypothetical protein
MTDQPQDLDLLATHYVRLVLAVGSHDADYVDAYYGPPELREGTETMSLAEIQRQAAGLLASMRSPLAAGADQLVRLRRRYLIRQLESLVARVGMLQGARLSFDEEAIALYDAEPPSFPEEYFRSVLEEMEGFLPPGPEPVHTRFEAFRKRFVIPGDRVDAVFSAAIQESRRRTRQHMVLPEQESFTVDYVTGKSWSGYNWYKGGNTSLIQVNTDFPITIDRAVDLASHEGYPGHHVYNAMLESALAKGRCWVEFTVYALFSPQSLIAEGTANFGIEMVFPGDERVAFEREVLFPLAGLPPEQAEAYYRAHAVFNRLGYAGNEAARRYLDGAITREEAARWLVEYALMSPERALQRTRFFDQYRSYVINYNLGLDLVRAYVEKKSGADAAPEKRWEVFTRLLSTPMLPSALS